MNYGFHIAIMACIYVMLASSLNLLVGQTGMLSLCHAAFYGLGAYTIALMSLGTSMPFWVMLLSAFTLAAVLSLVVSYPTIRLKGDYLVLGSLAFQMIVQEVLRNWEGLTGGSFGITGIPRPSSFGLSLDSLGLFLAFGVVVAIAMTGVLSGVMLSPFGRVLKAIRDDEVVAESLGKLSTLFKVKAFALAAGIAAVAGGIFAAYVSYIDPSSFGLDETLFIVACVIVGGTGSIRGPIIGAVVLTLLPEAIRFLQVPDAVAGNLRQVAYGLLIVVFMRLRPQGIAGDYVLR